MISPALFKTIPCPTYPEILLSLWPRRKLRRILQAFRPDAIHIATEGPLGLAARAYCVKRRLPFTTAFHTRFPEYINVRTGLPLRIGYAFMRWFHRPAVRTMVSTESLKRELEQWGMEHLVLWSRGVDTELFKPATEDPLPGDKPIFLYVGRVAVEKNIEAFLGLELDGSKYVVGDGPDVERLRKAYPEVRFPGYKTGADLARHYAAADVFVFPSKTDTFGLVILEALACGLPVAAYPVQGPVDIIVNGETGYVDDDLRQAALKALSVDRHKCREYAANFSWPENTRRFLGNLCPIVN